MSFFVKITVLATFFISIETFYLPCFKGKLEKICEKRKSWIRRCGFCENMSRTSYNCIEYKTGVQFVRICLLFSIPAKH